ESAGASPGPACYGRGGPFPLTDVNLLLGYMDPKRAGIPLDPTASKREFDHLMKAMRRSGETVANERALLEGLREIAVAKMSEAIRAISVREGVDVSDHALVAFGGAGPQHACSIAENLGVRHVLIPGDAGLLSAWGLERAVLQESAVKQVLRPLRAVKLEVIWSELETEARAALRRKCDRVRRFASLRLVGQESTMSIESEGREGDELERQFYGKYRRIFGCEVPEGREIEVVSLRVVVSEDTETSALEEFEEEGKVGPQLIQDRFSTCVVGEGWSMRRGSAQSMWLAQRESSGRLHRAKIEQEVVVAGLFRSRFEGILESMGETLKRCSISTNVKDRLDYSCALLDADGMLVASAPHVPVHLGALGFCVRQVVTRIPLRVGDVVITNDPAAGGSHLPDVTMIAAVYSEEGELIGYVANRAHHAEIGGMAPGSMPADARCLEEEGVCLRAMYLIEQGQARYDRLEELLTSARYPSRRAQDNLADAQAQVAACRFGVDALQDLVRQHGASVVKGQLRNIIERSEELMQVRLKARRSSFAAWDRMDDGAPLRVGMTIEDGCMLIDFAGSGPVHSGNLNATPAIVRSAILYSLRVWLAEDVPLNEGLLGPVEIRIPRGFLNPDFDKPAAEAPAVVGGNVEVSQRIVDLLLEALGVSAHGPGTMNNFLFGNSQFGYYETLSGGSGGGREHDGASGRHVHMTNTALTDPELMEQRYPVRVWKHHLR
ncbi:MAG: hydantoinase B/oxoprolinase family protein, partial [Verrucomicrobiales bacterium]